MDINENSVHVPRPEGMSGCGIWRLNDPSQPLYLWRASDVKLVGIEHRWRKHHRYLVGTSVRHAVQLILKHYPELRRTTDLAGLVGSDAVPHQRVTAKPPSRVRDSDSTA